MLLFTFSGMNSSSYKNRFKLNGFLSIDNAYTGGEISEINNELSGLGIYDYRVQYKSNNLLTVSKLVRAIATSDPLEQVIFALLGKQAKAIRAMIIDKNTDQNWVLDWHQDLRVAVKENREVAGFTDWSQQYGVTHVRAPYKVLHQMVAARIHLDSCTAENGAISIVPGSHCEKIFTEEEIKSMLGTTKPHPYYASPGNLMLMSPLLIHNSPPSRSKFSRRILSIEYSGAPLPGGLEFLC